jgi:hypothetical protein
VNSPPGEKAKKSPPNLLYVILPITSPSKTQDIKMRERHRGPRQITPSSITLSPDGRSPQNLFQSLPRILAHQRCAGSIIGTTLIPRNKQQWDGDNGSNWDSISSSSSLKLATTADSQPSADLAAEN